MTWHKALDDKAFLYAVTNLGQQKMSLPGMSQEESLKAFRIAYNWAKLNKKWSQGDYKSDAAEVLEIYKDSSLSKAIGLGSAGAAFGTNILESLGKASVKLHPALSLASFATALVPPLLEHDPYLKDLADWKEKQGKQFVSALNDDIINHPEVYQRYLNDFLEMGLTPESMKFYGIHSNNFAKEIFSKLKIDPTTFDETAYIKEELAGNVLAKRSSLNDSLTLKFTLPEAFAPTSQGKSDLSQLSHFIQEKNKLSEWVGEKFPDLHETFDATMKEKGMVAAVDLLLAKQKTETSEEVIHYLLQRQFLSEDAFLETAQRFGFKAEDLIESYRKKFGENPPDYPEKQAEKLYQQAKALGATFQALGTVISFSNPELGARIGQFGSVLSGALQNLASSTTNIWETIAFGANWINIGLAFISIFASSGKSNDQIILEELGKLREELQDFREEVYNYFQHLDKKLDLLINITEQTMNTVLMMTSEQLENQEFIIGRLDNIVHQLTEGFGELKKDRTDHAASEAIQLQKETCLDGKVRFVSEEAASEFINCFYHFKTEAQTYSLGNTYRSHTSQKYSKHQLKKRPVSAHELREAFYQSTFAELSESDVQKYAAENLTLLLELAHRNFQLSYDTKDKKNKSKQLPYLNFKTWSDGIDNLHRLIIEKSKESPINLVMAKKLMSQTGLKGKYVKPSIFGDIADLGKNADSFLQSIAKRPELKAISELHQQASSTEETRPVFPEEVTLFAQQKNQNDNGLAFFYKVLNHYTETVNAFKVQFYETGNDYLKNPSSQHLREDARGSDKGPIQANDLLLFGSKHPHDPFKTDYFPERIGKTVSPENSEDKVTENVLIDLNEAWNNPTFRAIIPGEVLQAHALQLGDISFEYSLDEHEMKEIGRTYHITFDDIYIITDKNDHMARYYEDNELLNSQWLIGGRMKDVPHNDLKNVEHLLKKSGVENFQATPQNLFGTYGSFRVNVKGYLTLHTAEEKKSERLLFYRRQLSRDIGTGHCIQEDCLKGDYTTSEVKFKEDNGQDVPVSSLNEQLKKYFDTDFVSLMYTTARTPHVKAQSEEEIEKNIKVIREKVEVKYKNLRYLFFSRFRDLYTRNETGTLKREESKLREVAQDLIIAKTLLKVYLEVGFKRVSDNDLELRHLLSSDGLLDTFSFFEPTTYTKELVENKNRKAWTYQNLETSLKNGGVDKADREIYALARLLQRVFTEEHGDYYEYEAPPIIKDQLRKLDEIKAKLRTP